MNGVLCFLKVKALEAGLTVAEMEIVEYKVEIEHLKCVLLPRDVKFIASLLYRRVIKYFIGLISKWFIELC